MKRLSKKKIDRLKLYKPFSPHFTRQVVSNLHHYYKPLSPPSPQIFTNSIFLPLSPKSLPLLTKFYIINKRRRKKERKKNNLSPYNSQTLSYRSRDNGPLHEGTRDNFINNRNYNRYHHHYHQNNHQDHTTSSRRFFQGPYTARSG